MNWKAAPLLNRSFAGNDCFVKDKDACQKQYEFLFAGKGYVACQNAKNAPSSKAYVQHLLEHAPDARRKGKLAVVTGVTLDGVGYYVARELAVQARMHVIMLGKSERGLKRCLQAIHNYAKKEFNYDEEETVLYKHRYDLASLESVKRASQYCSKISAQDGYDGKVSVLINQANVGTADARLTQEGLEYNTGCNFVATHYFITCMLPMLKKAASGEYKPRVASVASIGHVMGRRFQPHRLAKYPKEGGAPAGYILEQEDGSICAYEPEEDNGVVEDSDESLFMQSLINRLIQYRTATPQAPSPGHMAKVGTQVGRSKMAIVADSIHFSALHPEIAFCSYHAGATVNAHKKTKPEQFVQQYMSNYYSASQGARAPLRAALDPNMNTEPDLTAGAYLHADGNPWTPIDPTVTDPISKEKYSMPNYAKACYVAAESLLSSICG